MPSYIFLFIIIGIHLSIIWCTICCVRALKQTHNIAHWILNTPGDIDARITIFENVSFEKHLWTLFTFRNGYKLYKFEE